MKHADDKFMEWFEKEWTHTCGLLRGILKIAGTAQHADVPETDENGAGDVVEA